jgi:hypothetical protein
MMGNSTCFAGPAALAALRVTRVLCDLRQRCDAEGGRSGLDRAPIRCPNQRASGLAAASFSIPSVFTIRGFGIENWSPDKCALTIVSISDVKGNGRAIRSACRPRSEVKERDRESRSVQ